MRLLVFWIVSALFPASSIAGSFNPSLQVPNYVAANIDPVIIKASLPILDMHPRDITRITGKKLSLKERIGLMLLRHRLRKEQLQPPLKGKRNPGKTSFILGWLAMACLLLPFLFIASIPLSILAITIGSKTLKKDPHNKSARTGITLGIVTLAILFVAGLIVAFLLSIGPNFR